jgi:uncharacterized protein (TIGR02145 family)
MKTKILLSSILTFVFCLLSSQVPKGFTYQAIARDASDHSIANTSLPVTITIQSDSLGGIIYWEELHSAITTNSLGLFTLIIGKGARQASSTVGSFGDINWSGTPKFIKTQIFYHSALMNMGTSRLWSVPYSMVAQDISGPIDKLEVKGKTELSDEALFEVKNKKGQTVFAVYNDGVRVYVNDTLTKGTTKGGFAIGGFGTEKSPGHEYLRVTPDSIRAYITNSTKVTTKGGFAIGGFDQVKGTSQNYWVVNPDSIRGYIDTNPLKGATKGGFAIGGFGTDKTGGQEYLRVTPDSTRIYVNKGLTKGTTKGGFAIGGFDQVKSGSEEYLRVTSDSVKVSKSLLIPRLTTYERDNLSFVPGEALIIFNMTEGCMQIYKNNVWSNIWCFNCAPAFIIQPVDNTICSGNNVNFFVSATGTSLSYQWQQSTDNGTNWNNITNGGSNPTVSGAKSSSLTLSNVPVSYNSYKYRCAVAGSCLPNIISNIVSLNVGSHSISTQPANQFLSIDCSANFYIGFPGYGASYKWQQSSDGGISWTYISNGGTSPIYSGATTSTLSLTNVSWTYDNYRYRCLVSNLCGTDVTSDIASLTVPSDVITTQPENKVAYANQNIVFSVSTSGNGFNYQWQESINSGATWSNIINGGSLPIYAGANTSSLALTTIPVCFNNYEYRCIISHYCRPVTITNIAILSVPNNDPVTDVDGNSYNTIGIGSQLWMAKNLKTTKYSNGDLIGTTTPANLDISAEVNPKYQWSYSGNESNVDIYGRLYTWYTVTDNRNICPTGWHVPSDAEWVTLINYLGGQSSAGGKLKEYGTAHWFDPNYATGGFGFEALPGGLRLETGTFVAYRYYGFWWSSTEYNTSTAWYLYLINNNYYGFRDHETKVYGKSVRCVKDN